MIAEEAETTIGRTLVLQEQAEYFVYADQLLLTVVQDCKISSIGRIISQLSQRTHLTHLPNHLPQRSIHSCKLEEHVALVLHSWAVSHQGQQLTPLPLHLFPSPQHFSDIAACL